MLLTLTTPTAEYARAMSAALWALAVPNATGSTRYAVGWIAHATTGDVALFIPDAYRQLVHSDADVPAFTTVLAQAGVPQQELDDLAAALDTARGTEALVADLLPPMLQANALTDVQAQEAGWFSEVTA